MDYRKFLGREEELVLPYFGGATVDAKDRRLRVTAFEPPGWYRFSVKGRAATKKDATDAPPLEGLPAVRGHFLNGRLVRDGGIAEHVFFLPEEPPRFAPLKARRWPSGELLFDCLEFEGDAEGAVREALADGRSLETVKGVPATLRAAYAYAVIEPASKRLAIPFAPHEVRPALSRIATGGAPAAEAELNRLAAEREQARREMEELRRRQAAEAARAEVQAARERRVEEARKTKETVHERAEAALTAAGARLDQSRVLLGDRLEVVFSFMGERFISVVDAITFQVLDSGICLGHPPSDDLVTLDSLPSVIKEAIDDGALVILRFP
jgi:hypothetical protein